MEPERSVSDVVACCAGGAALFVKLEYFWSLSATGPSTKVLHSLVSKIRQYPQLTSHCMRLRAFIMGLLK